MQLGCSGSVVSAHGGNWLFILMAVFDSKDDVR